MCGGGLRWPMANIMGENISWSTLRNDAVWLHSYLPMEIDPLPWRRLSTGSESFPFHNPISSTLWDMAMEFARQTTHICSKTSTVSAYSSILQVDQPSYSIHFTQQDQEDIFFVCPSFTDWLPSELSTGMRHSRPLADGLVLGIPVFERIPHGIRERTHILSMASLGQPSNELIDRFPHPSWS